MIEKYGYLNLSIGREFNLSKKLATQLTLGTLFQLYDDITVKPPYVRDDNISTPILPSIGLATFYKL